MSESSDENELNEDKSKASHYSNIMPGYTKRGEKRNVSTKVRVKSSDLRFMERWA